MLTGGGAAALAAGLSTRRQAWAAAPTDRKFVFVMADGGWDVTKVFATVFSPHIARDRGDTVASRGELQWVSNRTRPAVDRWFQANGDRVSVVNGLLIRSINHELCTRLLLCNSTTTDRPDWPTMIGAAARDRYSVPHMVVQGMVIGAEYETFTCLTGSSGQLERLTDGSASAAADVPLPLPNAEIDALVDAYALAVGARKREEVTSVSQAQLVDAYAESMGRLAQFQDEASRMVLSDQSTFDAQINQAVQYLAGGTSRCVSMKLPGNFDTHTHNREQDALLDTAFASLDLLDRALRSVPGSSAPTLADETVVLVFSEMGRSPYINSDDGKDHWMYSSCLLWGPGVRGGNVVGGFDDHLVGVPVDPVSSEPDPSEGLPITPDMLGSTVLRLAGLDPVEELGADTSLAGVLL